MLCSVEILLEFGNSKTHGEWRQGEGRAENGVTMSSPPRAGAAWRGPSK